MCLILQGNTLVLKVFLIKNRRIKVKLREGVKSFLGFFCNCSLFTCIYRLQIIEKKILVKNAHAKFLPGIWSFKVLVIQDISKQAILEPITFCLDKCMNILNISYISFILHSSNGKERLEEHTDCPIWVRPFDRDS